MELDPPYSFISGRRRQEDSNTVTLDDKEADCSITVTAEVLEQLRDGELNPMMAVMSGKIKIAGDMGLAMKVQSLMG